MKEFVLELTKVTINNEVTTFQLFIFKVTDC